MWQYPKEIASLKYIPNFAVRGLHYDIEKGLLLKLDSFLQIQFGSVYRGLSPVSDEEVLSIYKNRIIPIAYVEGTRNAAQVRVSSETLSRSFFNTKIPHTFPPIAINSDFIL